MPDHRPIMSKDLIQAILYPFQCSLSEALRIMSRDLDASKPETPQPPDRISDSAPFSRPAPSVSLTADPPLTRDSNAPPSAHIPDGALPPGIAAAKTPERKETDFKNALMKPSSSSSPLQTGHSGLVAAQKRGLPTASVSASLAAPAAARPANTYPADSGLSDSESDSIIHLKTGRSAPTSPGQSKSRKIPTVPGQRKNNLSFSDSIESGEKNIFKADLRSEPVNAVPLAEIPGHLEWEKAAGVDQSEPGSKNTQAALRSGGVPLKPLLNSYKPVQAEGKLGHRWSRPTDPNLPHADARAGSGALESGSAAVDGLVGNNSKDDLPSAGLYKGRPTANPPAPAILRAADKLAAGMEPVLEQAYEISRRALPADREPAVDREHSTPISRVNNTFNVNVAMSANAGLTTEQRKALEDALSEILQKAARRQGLEV